MNIPKLLVVSERLRMLKPIAVGIGIRTKSPLDNESVMRGLTELSKAFSFLDEPEFSREEAAFFVKNRSSAAGQDVAIRIERRTIFSLSFPVWTKVDLATTIPIFMDVLQDAFRIYAINVSYLDIQLALGCDHPGNHYSAIWEVFFKTSSLSDLFESTKLFDDQISLRSVLDTDRSCAIDIGSDVSESEVREHVFNNDSLTVRVSVAQNQNFSIDDRFSKIYSLNAGIADSFIVEKFFPSVAYPLDEALAKLLSNSPA